MRGSRYLPHLLAATVLVPTVAVALDGSMPSVNLSLSLKDPPAVTRVTKAIIAIEGGITPEIARQFATMQDENVRTLAVYSGGGDPQSARIVGRLVRQRGLNVFVMGSCVAACAKYIFLAGANRTVAQDSVVGFNESAASVTLLASREPDPAVRNIYAAEASADRDYYRDLGLPERLLYDPQLLMHTLCYRMKRDTSGRMMDIEHSDQFRLVVLPKSYFDEIGIGVSGYWPTDPQDIGRLMPKLFRPDARPGFFLHVNVRPLDKVQNALRQTKVCPSNLPGSAPQAKPGSF